MGLKKGLGSIYKRGDTHWIKYYKDTLDPETKEVRKKMFRESCHSDREVDARRLLKERIGQMASGKFVGPQGDKVTVNELFARLLRDYESNNRKSLSSIKHHLKHLDPFFGSIRAQYLSSDVVKDYVEKRQKEEASNATINRELAALKRAFTLGIEDEVIQRRPYISALKEDNTRTGFFEHGDYLAMLEALPEYLRPVLSFAYLTGWRKSEIISLKWRQIDTEARTVRLDPGRTKNDKGRVIAVEGDLWEIIRGQWEKRKVAEVPGQSPTLLCPDVFHREGKPIKNFRTAWGWACKKTGLVGKLFHDLRRTAIRNMVRAGVPQQVAMMISGHKTAAVFYRYDIVSEDDLRQASIKVSEHIRRQASAQKVVPMSGGAAK